MLRIAIPTNRPGALANYKNALIHSGAEPAACTEPDPESCAGLLLPGGIDLHPTLYGLEDQPGTEYDAELDAIQLDALRRFLKARKPVLGICRGHQLINVALGGTLVLNLPSAASHSRLPSGTDNAHPCAADPGSWIAGIYGTCFAVNSSHHQGVDRPGKGMRTVLRAQDGVIEAMQHETLPVWGVQFHPERMCFGHRREDTVDGSLIFRFFLDKCRNA